MFRARGQSPPQPAEKTVHGREVRPVDAAGKWLSGGHAGQRGGADSCPQPGSGETAAPETWQAAVSSKKQLEECVEGIGRVVLSPEKDVGVGDVKSDGG